jgi:hypothetical protein
MNPLASRQRIAFLRRAAREGIFLEVKVKDISLRPPVPEQSRVEASFFHVYMCVEFALKPVGLF